MYLRSQIAPGNVGLPRAAHRRVPGLRRQEVAELAGVSEDWYRWFESGRPISVSPRFLARLSDALKLNAYDELTLFRLAMPDLYRAQRTGAVDAVTSDQSHLVPIRLPSEIEEARRIFDASREAFLTSDAPPSERLRPRIGTSWERSRRIHADPTLLQAPLALRSDDSLQEAREQNRELMRAALPVVASLLTTVAEIGYAIAVAEVRGRVLEVSGDRGALKLIERSGVVPGADLSEEAVGTNGVGTVIADRRPLQLMSAEHFAQAGAPLSCTGAPLRAKNGGICGVLVALSDYHLVRPALLTAITQAALEVEEELSLFVSAEALLV